MRAVLTIEEARRRAAKGAALLDAKRPGWAGRIDVEKLRMSDCCECILGQTFISENEWMPFSSGLIALDLRRVPAARDHGFDLPHCEKRGPGAWDTLRNAWVDMIRERTQ